MTHGVTTVQQKVIYFHNQYKAQMDTTFSKSVFLARQSVETAVCKHLAYLYIRYITERIPYLSVCVMLYIVSEWMMRSGTAFQWGKRAVKLVANHVKKVEHGCRLKDSDVNVVARGSISARLISRVRVLESIVSAYRCFLTKSKLLIRLA